MSTNNTCLRIIIVAIAVTLCWFSTMAAIMFGSGGGIDRGSLLVTLFITVISLPAPLLLVAILGYIYSWIKRQRQAKLDWSAVVEALPTIEPGDITLPLSVEVNFQKPLSNTSKGLTPKPHFFGDGSITIRDGGVNLEGVPYSWGFLFGGFGSAIVSSSVGLRKIEISADSIFKVQVALDNVLGATPAVINIFHKVPPHNRNYICAFSLKEVSDFEKLWIAMESQISLEKLVRPQIRSSNDIQSN